MADMTFSGVTFDGGFAITLPPPSYLAYAIFGYGGTSGSKLSTTNLVSNTGVVAADTTGVGTARQQLAAASYGLS